MTLVSYKCLQNVIFLVYMLNIDLCAVLYIDTLRYVIVKAVYNIQVNIYLTYMDHNKKLYIPL